MTPPPPSQPPSAAPPTGRLIYTSGDLLAVDRCTPTTRPTSLVTLPSSHLLLHTSFSHLFTPPSSYVGSTEYCYTLLLYNMLSYTKHSFLFRLDGSTEYLPAGTGEISTLALSADGTRLMLYILLCYKISTRQTLFCLVDCPKND